mgnify:CR=1 FL=1
MERDRDLDLGDHRRRIVVAVLGAALGRSPSQEEVVAGEGALSLSGERATRGTEPWAALPFRQPPGRASTVIV